MVETFWQGALAGLAIALPVGAIAVLIIDLGVRRGFGHAAAAGLGTASADLVYAAAAAAAGTVIADVIRPVVTPLRVVAVGVLVAIALRGLLLSTKREPLEDEQPTAGRLKVYVTFLGLTLLNPATVVYFASLIVGLDLTDASRLDKVMFVVGAGLASAAWQTLLAGGAAFLRTRSSERFRRATSAAGSVVILLLAAQTALKL